MRSPKILRKNWELNNIIFLYKRSSISQKTFCTLTIKNKYHENKFCKKNICIHVCKHSSAVNSMC